MVKKIKLKIKEKIFSLYSNEKKARIAGVILGNSNFIASVFWSTEPYLINIGNNCQITNGVKIFTHGGGGAVRKKYPNFDCFGKVVIGDYVYIGNHSLIMPGVTIGDNVLIAAGSVVTKSVPANTVIGGNPAKIICSTEDYIENNNRFNLNSKGMSARDKKKLLLSTPENKFIVKNEMKY
jgi:acetyltransferase-like isoleucine patch superfamily enzyme